jgi:hypothetical protein
LVCHPELNNAPSSEELPGLGIAVRVKVMSFSRRWERLLVGKAGVRDRRRWIGPLIAGVGSALVIWFVMPGVPWYFRVPLSLLAFIIIGGQSAALLSRDD